MLKRLWNKHKQVFCVVFLILYLIFIRKFIINTEISWGFYHFHWYVCPDISSHQATKEVLSKINIFWCSSVINTSWLSKYHYIYSSRSFWRKHLSLAENLSFAPRPRAVVLCSSKFQILRVRCFRCVLFRYMIKIQFSTPGFKLFSQSVIVTKLS